MSPRARRMGAAVTVQPFAWSVPATACTQAAAPDPPDDGESRQHQTRLAELEREAFAKGYQQGERAGLEAGSTRVEAMVRRLAQTLEELADVRRAMIRETERQMVELALAIAKRIVRREVALDRELTLTMARLALERLGESSSVTVRLHPDDFAAVADRGDWAGSHVSVVADPKISRGGCRVESDFGMVDATIDAQFQELARALLVDEGQMQPIGVSRER